MAENGMLQANHKKLSLAKKKRLRTKNRQQTKKRQLTKKRQPKKKLLLKKKRQLTKKRQPKKKLDPFLYRQWVLMEVIGTWDAKVTILSEMIDRLILT
jgi:hypothetical protein